MLDVFPDAGEIRFRKVRDAGSVLNATFALVRRNARELILSFLAIVAPLVAAAGLASGLAASRMAEVFTDPEALLRDPFALLGPGYLIGLVLALLSSIVAQAAVGGYVRLYRQGEAGTVTPGRLWEETQDLILPLLGLSALFFLAAMLSAVLNIIPCLGTLAWVGLIVWAWPVVAVAVASRVIETDTIGDAWQRARALVKDSWGFTFGALFLSGVVAGVLLMAVGVVGALAGAVLGVGIGFDFATAPQGLTVASAVLQAGVQVVSYPAYILPFLTAFFVHGRLAEEMDGSRLGDDLATLADAGFGTSAWTPGMASEPPVSTPLPPAPPAAEPEPNDRPDEDSPQEPPSGFRGGGFGDSA